MGVVLITRPLDCEEDQPKSLVPTTWLALCNQEPKHMASGGEDLQGAAVEGLLGRVCKKKGLPVAIVRPSFAVRLQSGFVVLRLQGGV